MARVASSVLLESMRAEPHACGHWVGTMTPPLQFWQVADLSSGRHFYLLSHGIACQLLTDPMLGYTGLRIGHQCNLVFFWTANPQIMTQRIITEYESLALVYDYSQVALKT